LSINWTVDVNDHIYHAKTGANKKGIRFRTVSGKQKEVGLEEQHPNMPLEKGKPRKHKSKESKLSLD
jgi:hypothetical protein